MINAKYTPKKKSKKRLVFKKSISKAKLYLIKNFLNRKSILCLKFSCLRWRYSKIIKNVDYVIDTLGISEFIRELSVLKTHGKILSLRGMPNKSFAERYKIKGLRKLLFTIAGQKYDKLAKKQGKSYEFMFVKENGEELKYITKIVEDNKIHPATDPNEWKIDNFEETLNYFYSKKAKGKILFTFD